MPPTVSAAQAGDRPAEPRYELERLLAKIGLTPTEFASEVGRSRAHVYRRLKDGVPWSEADDWAIHFHLYPWEVWPEWADADPATWCDLPDDPSSGTGSECTDAA